MYLLQKLLPTHTVAANLSRQIHLQDAESSTLKPNVVSHDPRPFLRKGLPGSPPPISFESALGTLLRLARVTEGQVSGEQIFDHINILLAPFIKGVPSQRVQDAVQVFLSQLNWEGFSNTLPFRSAIGLGRTI